MNKIAVIGNNGSGKSTFAKNLHNITGLPLYHLDKIFWNSGWQESTRVDFDNTVSGIILQEQWIMDGTYSRTLAQRLTSADTVIFLDFPFLSCFWALLTRGYKDRGKTRSDMADGCYEKISFAFSKHFWSYPSVRKPRILKILKETNSESKLIVFKNRKEIQEWLKNLAK